mmetsp:Transcript_18034/g.44162  ORF Transcript_18034/g.44162 Transcript_18034/m.44162 type:complete len:260 (+) Transcript_18034:4390-5169(+)
MWGVFPQVHTPHSPTKPTMGGGNGVVGGWRGNTRGGEHGACGVCVRARVRVRVRVRVCARGGSMDDEPLLALFFSFLDEDYLGPVRRILYPNGWREGFSRKVTVVENSSYYGNGFATGFSKLLTVLVFLFFLVSNSMYYTRPSKQESLLINELYKRCDIDGNGRIDKAELACFPFDQEFRNFKALGIDTNGDGFASEPEFRRFVLGMSLYDLARRSRPRYLFGEALRILVDHAKGKVARKDAKARLRAIAPKLVGGHGG